MTKVWDAMSSRDLVVVRPDDSLALAARLMLGAGIRHLAVMREGAVVGVVSETDILRRKSEMESADHQPVSVAMSAPTPTIGPDEQLVSALTVMLENRLDCLPVVMGGELVGMLTTTDIVRYQVESAPVRPAEARPPKAGEIMKRAPAVVSPASKLFDVAALMARRGVRHLPVVDPQRRVLGIVSDRDLRSAMGDLRAFLDEPASRERVRALTAADVMTRKVISIPVDMPIPGIVSLLVNERVGALPVVDGEGRLVGIVSYLDALHALR